MLKDGIKLVDPIIVKPAKYIGRSVIAVIPMGFSNNFLASEVIASPAFITV